MGLAYVLVYQAVQTGFQFLMSTNITKHEQAYNGGV